MDTNQSNFLASVISESERYLPVLRQWADRGVCRNPLDNSLLINYPPITAASPVTQDDYSLVEQALSALRPDCGIALYAHIPFCSRRCTYCNYYSLVKNGVPDSYIDLLEKELGLYKDILGAKPVSVRSIYIGGGTPSLLTELQLERILGFIHKSFTVQPQAEVSMEFHPEIINNKGVGDYLKTISRLGVNRVSVGIQSLDDKVLTAINRGHTKEEALAFLGLIAEQDFSKLNFDIIYGGLPSQSMGSVYETLKTLLAFKPTSITKHFCEIKSGSHDFIRYKDNPALYPDWTENIRTQTLIDMLLGQNGYQKELLHMYTNTPFSFSHQKQKWGSPETVLLCLGPGTYGWIFHNKALKNLALYKTFSLTDYQERVLAGILPIERLASLGKDETARRHIQYALNYGYLDKAYLQSLLEETSSQTSQEISLIISRLIKNKFLGESQDIYRINPLGEYLSDEIKALFASQEVLNHEAGSDIHARHHWYPGLDLIKNFKNIMLNGESSSAVN